MKVQEKYTGISNLPFEKIQIVCCDNSSFKIIILIKILLNKIMNSLPFGKSYLDFGNHFMQIFSSEARE